MKTNAYEQVTRTMVTQIRTDINEIKTQINDIDSKITDLFNHQSSRLPTWATALITLLCSLVTGLVVKGLG